jgi:hypothetical protein
MRFPSLTSIAMLTILLLIGQSMTGHLSQIPGHTQSHELESTPIVMSSNNTTDTDGDGVMDVDDDCPNGTSNWNSTVYTDHDSDGCQDTTEDTDDDNDGLADVYDDCPLGELNWMTSSLSDYDSDGCQDATSEDLDDDNDGILDADDACLQGDLNWVSNNSNDADGDGCQDSTEDMDGGDGSNTGGNNTGGNNTGGNNTGGNNTGGNNTGGNNTGGNNTGGNNTGGNNTSPNDAHCLTVGNVSMTPNYSVSVDLVNTCSFDLNYPGVNASSDNTGVTGLPTSTYWYYLIGANGTYSNSWQLAFDQNISNNTQIVLQFDATIVNCGGSSLGHQCPNSTTNYTFTYINPVDTGGNNTSGNNTTGNNTSGNNNSDNNNSGNNTSGNNTSGNNTSGNNTSGNNTSGNNTSDNNNSGNSTGGNNTSGNNTSDNNTVDTDYDGIIDSMDNCPSIGNPSQTDLDQDGVGDGCDADIDGDGMTNADDAFPSDATEQSDLDGDGVGDNTDSDDDGDGIPDVSDTCPFIANADQADLDGDGVGNACDGLEITVDENGTIGVASDSIPALGMVGTAAAISLGLFIAIRREGEE